MVDEDNQLEIICTYIGEFVFGPVVQTFSCWGHNKVDTMAADALPHVITRISTVIILMV